MVSANGKFRLTCKKPADKFYLTNINADIPLGKGINEKDYFYDVTGPIEFLLIDRIQTFFNPDVNDIDAKNVAALIRHRDVRLEDMSEEEHQLLVRQGLKKDNPGFTLINLDKSVIDKHREDVEMYEISYLITRKKDGLSKKKLMFITSALSLSTRSEIVDEERYMAFLQQQLINHLKSNVEERETFMFYYDKIAEAETIYYINQFIDLGFIKDFGGMFKLEDKPIGFDIQSIKQYFANNEDEYNAYKLRVDEFNSNKVYK